MRCAIMQKKRRKIRSDRMCYWHVSAAFNVLLSNSEQAADKVRIHEGLDKENG